MPREGHDLRYSQAAGIITPFQSTCPARGTTDTLEPRIAAATFQSTCPARGTTVTAPFAPKPVTDFNPRAPRGARRGNGMILFRRCRFQSTCPARGTTRTLKMVRPSICISIHVPREGHDPRRPRQTMWTATFQSTCPARGTTSLYLISSPAAFRFQSTCPARGTTHKRRRSPQRY